MSEEVTFKTPGFEGSLDLLLFLVRKHEMDIKNIQLSLIADEFMGYIQRMESLDVEISADFLVMASTLMELKSKALLVKNEQEQQELEKAKRQLSQQLEEYEKVKDMVEFLDEKARLAEKIFNARATTVPHKRAKKVEQIPDELFESFRQAYQELKLREKVYRLKGEQYSVSKRVQELLIRLTHGKRIFLQDLFHEAKDRIDLIVFFLAVLEVVKLEKGKIEHRSGNWVLEASPS
ncbi:MAG TPA: segregation/condensation protein A [Thermotogota bacterium]|nr:segregation/condensation protein A [Thermotogota bacterium]HRW91731.1 segregation/condensation protein A [Thermotogota bacterium]